ncbi:hypothetical protein [Paenibacillus qinlingensis]|uniref:hypothetical protein n=1 Tax=Paenibacillus qinlingensis TaxID=1837343 RepID=UPI002367FA50|nr:hypothetical protein [Paenibacillus qinlingensis]
MLLQRGEAWEFGCLGAVRLFFIDTVRGGIRIWPFRRCKIVFRRYSEGRHGNLACLGAVRLFFIVTARGGMGIWLSRRCKVVFHRYSEGRHGNLAVWAL